MGLRGPKKGVKYRCTVEKERIRDAIRSIVEREVREMVERQIDRAKGCAIIDKKDDTGERIYDLPPDPAAFKTLIEQAIGKAPQALDITSDGDRLGFLTPEDVLERMKKLKK
jgi:hypothetical protein